MSAEIASRRNFSKIGATRPRTEIEAARTRLLAVNFVRIGRPIISSCARLGALELALAQPRE